MAWKVDPAGVQSVLKSVATESTPIYDALGKVDATVQSAATAAQSEPIAKALEAFFTSMKTPFETVQRRVPAAIDGAAAATNAILAGDEQMAAAAEANAVASGKNGNFDFFTALETGGGK